MLSTRNGGEPGVRGQQQTGEEREIDRVLQNFRGADGHVRTDLHVHTFFSDGTNDPETMVRAAIANGMEVLGFSDHGYTDFDESYCIPKARLAEYRTCIRELAEKYRGRIRILCGIEQDIDGGMPIDDYDYVIGSVHYVNPGQEYLPVDMGRDRFAFIVEEAYNGDPLAFAEDYYRKVSCVVERTGCDIIGHFDLVTKFNADEKFFRFDDPRYLAAAFAAIDRLLPYGCPFEINTGAMARGYRSDPYPHKILRDYIRAKGGRFILSSDSHNQINLMNRFTDYEGEL